ncbi:MAG: carbohydrate kinase family protein [Armatimonadota bacterium]|jgi:sugar/nucleoside kinase (ribokinase family)
MHDIVTIGTATQDVFLTVGSATVLQLAEPDVEQRFLAFEYPAKIDVGDILVDTGGGATNTAITFARFGLKTAFFGKLGDDEPGRQVIRRLEQEGIDCSLAVTTGEHHTGFSVILTSFEGDRTILVHRGANNQLRGEDIDWDRLEQTRWVYISSLGGSSSEWLDEIAHFAEEHGISAVMNPGSHQIRQGVDAMCNILGTLEVLFLNRREAALMTGVGAAETVVDADEPGFDREEWAASLQPTFERLKQCGPKAIVISDGANGSCAYDGTTLWSMPALPAEVTSTVGAGDAYCAAFVAVLVKGGDVPRAMQIGTANAAAAISQVGAKSGILTHEQASRAIEGCEDPAAREVSGG